MAMSPELRREKRRVSQTAWRRANPGHYAAWYRANAEKARASAAAWYRANAEKVIARTSAWQRANPEKKRASAAAWRRANPEKARANPEKERARRIAWHRANPNPEQKRARGALRRARKLNLSTPLTPQERVEILVLYANARALTYMMGEPYHVDHIQPLAKGGLHHPKNLQVLLGVENMRKGATWGG